jgi:hypothetical protein
MSSFAWRKNGYYRGSADECWRYLDPSTRRLFEVRIDREPRCDPDDPERRFPDRFFLDELTPNGRLINPVDETWDIPHDEWVQVQTSPSRAGATLASYEAQRPGFMAIHMSHGYSCDSIYLPSWVEVDAAVGKALSEDSWYVAHGSLPTDRGVTGRLHGAA